MEGAKKNIPFDNVFHVFKVGGMDVYQVVRILRVFHKPGPNDEVRALLIKMGIVLKTQGWFVWDFGDGHTC